MEKYRLPSKKTACSICSLSPGFVLQKNHTRKDSGAAFGFWAGENLGKNNLIIDLRKNKPEKVLSIFWKKIISPSFVMRFLSLFLVFTFGYYSVISIGGTVAFFSDHEKSVANIFTSSDLRFTLALYSPDSYRTQTQGGWGSKPKGDNPGTYLKENFDLAFPGGVKIGIDAGHSAVFDSSEAIRTYLPSSGKPSQFEKDHENPKKTEAGALAGQTLALALNIGFDEYDEDFGSGNPPLADLYVNGPASPCFDLSVGEVFVMANEILSGIIEPISLSAINECVDEINNKFVDGKKEALVPGESEWRELSVENTGRLDMNYRFSIETPSNHAPLCEALKIEAYLNEQEAYIGSFMDFYYESSLLWDQSDKWRLVFYLPVEADSGLKEQQCVFEYTLDGWQKDISVAGGGFSNTAVQSDIVMSGFWEDGVLSNQIKDDDFDNTNRDFEIELLDNTVQADEMPTPNTESFEQEEIIIENETGDILPEEEIIPEDNYSVAEPGTDNEEVVIDKSLEVEPEVVVEENPLTEEPEFEVFEEAGPEQEPTIDSTPAEQNQTTGKTNEDDTQEEQEPEPIKDAEPAPELVLTNDSQE